MKTCSSCRNSAPKEGFIRKGREWKTCNLCSLKGSYNRKVQSGLVYDNLGRLMQGLRIGQPIDQVPAQFQYQQQLVEQVQFQQQQQQLAQQQFQNQAKQRDQRMTIDYLLNDPEYYEPVPSQLFEQQQEMMHRTQQIYQPESTPAQTNQHLPCPVPASELFVQPLPTFPVDPDMGMPPRYEPLDPNVHCDLRTNGAEQADDNFNFLLGPGDPDLDFDKCLANALCAESHGVEQSFFDEPSLDNGIGRTDSMSPTGCATKYQPPYSLESIFANFNASQDLLDQPTTPNRDLTGAALTAHLISELGLAFRLSKLQARWRNMKQLRCLKEVNMLANLENDKHTLWGPLSDALTMYEVGLEDVIDHRGYNKALDLQMQYSAKKGMGLLALEVKLDVGRRAREAMQRNIGALLELLMDGTEHSEQQVKTELDRQLVILKKAVHENCEDHGVLRLKMDRFGTYIAVLRGSSA